MQTWLLDVWSDMSKTILFVTHHLDKAIFRSDEIHVFTARRGRIKAHVTVTLDRPRTKDLTTTPPFTDGECGHADLAHAASFRDAARALTSRSAR